MLSSISIRNVVLIESLDIDFGKGLLVFTGETGAGKSIFMDSLMLALGTRSDVSLVRNGQDKLSVSSSFVLPKKHPLFAILKEQEIDVGDDMKLTLRRIVNSDGKSKAFVNDISVSAGLLRQIGDLLVEVHAQFANYDLLDSATHMQVLDRYGKLEDMVSSCESAFSVWQEKSGKRKNAAALYEQAKKEEEFLRFGVQELEDLKPQKGEITELESRRTALVNSQRLMENLNQAQNIFNNDNPEHLVGNIMTFLEKAEELLPGRFSSIIKMLDTASIEIGESAKELEDICQNLDLSPEQLEQVDDRLFAIKDLARKHKVEAESLPDLLYELKDRLQSIELGDDNIKRLKEEENKAFSVYADIASDLSNKRKEAAVRLNEAVQKELAGLKLEKAKFFTNIESMPAGNGSKHGVDKVMFMAATNQGQALTPIHKSASGGELARFMLALKVNLAATIPCTSLVFDEVDTGIGGAAASAVGFRLKKLAKDKQILVVTHSPQVASFSDAHYKIEKDEKTTCRVLTATEKVMEVARMLSGEKITGEAKEAAKALIEANK